MLATGLGAELRAQCDGDREVIKRTLNQDVAGPDNA